MKKKFYNYDGYIAFDENGITVQEKIADRFVFFPYGSINKMKIGMLGLSINGNGISSQYVIANGTQKQKIKDILPTIEAYNSKAAKCTAIIAGEPETFKIEKSLDSFCQYYGDFDIEEKHSKAWQDAVVSALSLMKDDEEIIYTYWGRKLSLKRNANFVESDDCYPHIGIITNKKFYYVAKQKGVLIDTSRAGAIDLRDIHAIEIKKDISQYILFDVKNDNYQIEVSMNAKFIKDKLEECIRSYEVKESKPVESKPALSAIDEIKQFKELLDMGIITQEEFDAKKKQLLAL